MIFVPKHRSIEVELDNGKFGLEGWFTLRSIRRSGRVTREWSFKNLITDYGMDRIGAQSSTGTYRYIHVGTGTAPPDFSDTDLGNFIDNLSTANPSNSSGGVANEYGWMRMTLTSAIGQLGNINLTEIGVSHQTGNGGLFSKQLIVDPGGSPAAFPIADDEQLQATYELRFYPPDTDSPATVSVGSNSYDALTRALNINSSLWGPRQSTGSNAASNFTNLGNPAQNGAFSGGLAARSATNPLGTNLGNASSASTAGYTDGNRYRDMTATWGTGVGNGSIMTVRHAFNSALFQTQFDPVISKTDTQILNLSQRISWARR